ncbi:MAG: primosome assembly protein PriA, partial [Nakamurella sp.]
MRRRAPVGVPEPTTVDPVARVVVDTGLAHLDRPFDYLVPEPFDEQARPGVRVRVRFAGRLVDGYLLERVAESDSGKKLSFLDRVVSSEPVLTPEIAGLCRAVADRYAGSMEDVLRRAAPPRHAATEAKPAAEPDTPQPPMDTAEWARYQAGPAFLQALGAGRPARAVWQALPGEDWPARLAEL